MIHAKTCEVLHFCNGVHHWIFSFPKVLRTPPMHWRRSTVSPDRHHEDRFPQVWHHRGINQIAIELLPKPTHSYCYLFMKQKKHNNVTTWYFSCDHETVFFAHEFQCYSYPLNPPPSWVTHLKVIVVDPEKSLLLVLGRTKLDLALISKALSNKKMNGCMVTLKSWDGLSLTLDLGFPKIGKALSSQSAS